MSRNTTEGMLLAALAMCLGPGCVVVSKNKLPVVPMPDKQVVVKDGQLYVVDLETRTAEQVPWDSDRVERIEIKDLDAEPQ